MTKFAMVGAGVLALGLWAAPARAQQNAADHKPGDVPGPIDSISDLQDSARMLFKLADENNDNQISQKEAIDATNLLVGGFFFRADQNGDGVLSRDEARAARDAFMSSKPWLRYVVETVRTSPEARNAANARGNNAGGAGNQPNSRANMLATLVSTFDTNNDKQLQAAELRQAVQTAVQSEFATADTNRDGQLSPAELNASVAGLSREISEASFRQADTDNNGQISMDEFEKSIVQPSRVVFRIIDLNHDGQISPQEAQTARQVLMSRLRALNLPEPSNSPRHQLNSALGNAGQPGNAGGQAPQAPANPPGR